MNNNITKEKIISLIKEYAKDEKAIEDYRLYNYKYNLLRNFNLMKISEKSLYINYNCKSDFIKYNKIDVSNYIQNKDVYSLGILFDRLPNIIIQSRKNSISTKQKVKGKFLKFIPIDIDVTITEDVYDYTLKYGHHKFEISFDEVKEIFNFIVEENRKIEERISNIEISKRFEAYNIK